MTSEEIKNAIKAEDVKIISLRFTDLAGKRREVCYPASKIDDVLAGRVDYDGSSVKGFLKIDEGTLSLLPDVASFRIDPWLDKPAVAFMMADSIDPDGKPYRKSPRTMLKKAISSGAAAGYSFVFGVEMEFFFLREEGGVCKLLDTADYCEYPSSRHIFYELLEVIEDLRVDSEPSIHEHGPSQYEIHFAPDDPVALADKVMVFKDLAESVAARHGIKACFMPKPFSGLPGNGMHIHMSVWDKDKTENLFWDGEKHRLSELGLKFMAGIMEHTPGLAAFFAPTINSYKRLVPGYEAPCTICWGLDNRSTTFRISPFSSMHSAKLEFRAPDMSCDPYLTFGGLIRSGLDGLEHDYELPLMATGNTYQYGEEEMEKYKMKYLPEDLREALDELSKDEVLMDYLGVAGSEYLRMKKEEWREEMTTVWPIERKWYYHSNAFMKEEIGRDSWRNTSS